jgi:amino acid transporter
MTLFDFYVCSGVAAFFLNLWYENWDLDEAWPWAFWSVVPVINTFIALLLVLLIGHHFYEYPPWRKKQ